MIASSSPESPTAGRAPAAALVAAAVLALVALVLAPASPALAGEPLTPVGEAPDPHWNKVHTFEEIEALLQGWARAYPDWVTLESIGKSIEGRDLWLVTVNNPNTGPDTSKPAMYIDGAIHANEIQAADTALYTIEYLLENYGELDRVTELLDRAAFYFVPVVTPDGRVMWFEEPSTPNFPRSVMTSVDDDRDGRAEEDGFDDLDGDGIITQMRKRVPAGLGDFKLHPDDPRLLVPVEDGEAGDWIALGTEGFDNDGDGRLNEDAIGYVDPNRTWGYFWQPEYVQAGAGPYPLSIPETRSIAVWALDHPNVAAVQSYHNTGQMILRGPGSKLQPNYPREDIEVYDVIGEQGEELLPDYNYWVTWEDLYTVYGGTTDHFYGVHGVVSFTNELYGLPADFDEDGEISDEERMKFNDLLTLGRQYVPWTQVEHPDYGTVEVGGFRQDAVRMPEGWALEQEIHRNNAFVLFHAYHLPKIRFGDPRVERLDGDLWRIELPVLNERAIPTVSAEARRNTLHRFDVATLEGAEVVASGLVREPWIAGEVDLQDERPERLMVPGVPSFGHQTLFFLVEGEGEVTVTYDSLKGGTLSRTVSLDD